MVTELDLGVFRFRLLIHPASVWLCNWIQASAKFVAVAKSWVLLWAYICIEALAQVLVSVVNLNLSR